MTIYLMLANYKTYIFLTLTSNFSISIIALVDRAISSIVDISTLVVFSNYLICVNKSLTYHYL